MSRRLGTVAPREQVGPRTGAQYEFQYGEAALACLELLAEGDDACIYCEWHDDYVIERGSGRPQYEFFQVKSRSMKLGPWPWNEILGVVGKRARHAPKQSATAGAPSPAKKGRKKTPKPPTPLTPAAEVGIAGRLLEHHRNFPGACAAFAVVSTHKASDDAFLDLLTAAAEVRHQPNAGSALLDANEQALFGELVAAYQKRDPAITQEDVWQLISRLRIQDARGRVGEPGVLIGLIGQRIYDLSEVDLQTSEQRRVAADLIERVRAKSHRVLSVQPLPTEAEIRSSKAIDLDEILSLLALSPSGYRELKNGGRTDVREYSRLHRMCKASGMTPQMIDAACRLRVRWLQWRSENRDYLMDDLLLVVEDGGRQVLDLIRRPGTTWQQLHAAADATAMSLRSTPGLPELDAKIVLGLVFELASEAPHG